MKYYYSLLKMTGFAFLIIGNTEITKAHTVQPKFFCVIDVIMDDSSLINNSTIRFDMCRNDINILHSGYTDSNLTEIRAERTRIIVPLSTSLNYGRIELDEVWRKKGILQNRPLNDDNNLFLFQNHDTIEIHLSDHKGGVYFKGKAANRFNCMYKVGCINGTETLNRSNAYRDLKDFKASIMAYKFEFDSLYTLQANIVKQYREKSDAEIYNLILLDCWACQQKAIIEDGFLYGSFSFSDRQEEYKAAKDLFIDLYVKAQTNNVINSNLRVKSYRYADFLYAREKAFAVIMNSTDKVSYYPNLKFAEVNSAIDLHFKKGILKDKIKLLAFLNATDDKKSQQDFPGYLDEAIVKAGEDRFKAALEQFKYANAQGATAYPFALTDVDGKIVKLDDFKGKLVILDFWFTHCGGCAAVAAKLKPIIANYKNNPGVVFITICTDKDKNGWENSLIGGKYTSNDEINLWAGVGERQSPIIQHYKIESWPTLIAISKKGKIISINVPNPCYEETAFIKLLNKNMNM